MTLFTYQPRHRIRRANISLASGLLLVSVFLAGGDALGQDARAWVEPMKQVNGRFKGERGTFATFGDSITVSLAFWSPLRSAQKNAGAEMQSAFKLVNAHMKPECWDKWRGPGFGNEGGMTILWADKNVQAWLQKHNPETALIMFGTNDLTSVPLEIYKQKTRHVVEACLNNGTVVILSTIPPRSGMLEKSRQFAGAVRAIAKDLKVPLCDYHAECLKRRPDDWDGAAPQFKDYKGYEVPTLLARDGVHPSNPANYQGDYSDDALKRHGYGLRNYVTLLAYADVIQSVLEPRKK